MVSLVERGNKKHITGGRVDPIERWDDRQFSSLGILAKQGDEKRKKGGRDKISRERGKKGNKPHFRVNGRA